MIQEAGLRWNESKILFCLAFVCGTTVALALPASRQARRENPATAPRGGNSRVVGRFEPASLETPHPYLADPVSGGWTRVVSDPGATYLRLHFRRFDLAPGDWLEIAGRDGDAPRVYTGRGLEEPGDFWAFTVDGDLAILTLHASVGGRGGFEIDGYGRGIAPIGEPVAAPASQPGGASASLVSGPESQEPDPTGLVCGTQDWSDVACYASNRPLDAQHARGAVLAIEGCCTTSTAFKVSDSGQFMTSYHPGVSDIELRLGYERTECGGTEATSIGKVAGGEVLRADPILDYTLFTTLGDASAVPCLQLDRRQPALGERLYVPQYPWGAPLKIAIWSDSDAGGWCSVVPIPWVAGNLAPQTSQIGYFCDTAEGSLGAPVLSGSTHRVVGIHHIGLCPNAASRMDLIWPQIAGLADDCSNGFACEPVSGDRCNCDGACSGKERRYIERGGLCADCWEEPAP